MLMMSTRLNILVKFHFDEDIVESNLPDCEASQLLDFAYIPIIATEGEGEQDKFQNSIDKEEILFLICNFTSTESVWIDLVVV